MQNVSRSVTCQLELNISSTRAFKKCKSRGGIPTGESIISKNMLHFEYFWSSICNKREIH